MATVTEVKNGWVIHWFTNASGSTQNIQCGQTSLELKSTFVNNQVNLTLNEIQGKRFSQMICCIIFQTLTFTWFLNIIKCHYFTII